MDLLELFTDLYPRTGMRYPPRTGTNVACRAGAPATGPDTVLSLVNLSDAGVRLVLRTALDVGQLVEVELLAPGWKRPVHRSGVVVWARGLEEGTSHAGIFFSRSLSPVEFRDLCQARRPA